MLLPTSAMRGLGSSVISPRFRCLRERQARRARCSCQSRLCFPAYASTRKSPSRIALSRVSALDANSAMLYADA